MKRFTAKRVPDMRRTYNQMYRTDKYAQHSSIIWPVGLNCQVFIYELSMREFDSSCIHLNYRFHFCFEQGFLDIEPTIECGFTLKNVRDMTGTYSQIHLTSRYKHHSSIIWPVWQNGWKFVYELSGCVFESIFNDLNFRFHVCSEQGVPWHSGNYRVWNHCETGT